MEGNTTASAAQAEGWDHLKHGLDSSAAFAAYVAAKVEYWKVVDQATGERYEK